MLPAFNLALFEEVPVNTALLPSAEIVPFGFGNASRSDPTAGDAAALADSDGTVPIKV
jgi:hypothetical protein